jgi:DDE superfamily endonuclease
VSRLGLGAGVQAGCGCPRRITARTASGISTAALVLGDDQLWGVNRRRKGGDHSLSAIKSIRAARPDGAPVYVIMDNLSANKTPAVRAWAARNKVELCLTPTYASWANPIEAQFGPLRTFTMGASDYPRHPALACRMSRALVRSEQLIVVLFVVRSTARQCLLSCRCPSLPTVAAASSYRRRCRQDS